MANTSETSSVPPPDLPHTGGGVAPEFFLVGALVLVLVGLRFFMRRT